MSDKSEKPAADKNQDGAAYRVLARKYRPVDFTGLMGQEAMVQTLSNAMETGRVAHAFVLTGVRGIGKTTTARIIARALNCVGPDGKRTEPTIEPCGECEPCIAISEDRHVDVLEIDAASNTGVDNVRDIIDSVRYRPVSARYKVYIVDEVHMLSRAAFNALLKTLEEPPPHVKFIFATTEIRKVPVTVLSRCQRFDLRRVPRDMLAGYLGEVAGKEDAKLSDDALQLLARAADGSVRDGLSLLDQAISHVAAGETVEPEAVRAMLGLADRAVVIDLFDAVMKGDAGPALDILGDLYLSGADPLVVVKDLLELTHWLTRLKIVENAAETEAVGAGERQRATEMAAALPMAALTRAWQILMKGLDEVQFAPNPLQAAEMLLIRLAYAAELPPPSDLVRKLTDDAARDGGAASGASSPAPNGGGTASALAPTSVPAPAQAASGVGGGARPMLAAVPDPLPDPLPDPGPKAQPESGLHPESEPPPPDTPPPDMPPPDMPPEGPGEFDAPQPPVVPAPADFPALVALFDERREPMVATHLRGSVHLVRYAPPRIEFRPTGSAPRDLAGKIAGALERWTGDRWTVAISSEPGDNTLTEQAVEADAALHEEARKHPLVRAAMEAFPESRITSVRPAAERPAETPDAAGESDDERKSE